MPIIRFAPENIDQVCARCGAENRHQLSALVAGDVSALGPEPDLCRLPACLACGAVEYLVRTWDQHPEPESRSALHRRTVNRLFAKLLARGRVEQRCAATYQAETSPPPDLLADDGQPLELERPEHIPRPASGSE